MPQITAIKPQKRQGRFNIFVDGKFAFALSAEALAKAELRTDQEISEEEIKRLIQENEFQKVYDRVLKFFSYRPRSEKELQDWFLKKQVGERTQKLIKQKLSQLGYLNDEEFAKWWIEQRTNFKPSGKRLLMVELKQKGIDKEIIARLLSCYIDKDQEKELAQKIAEKKLKSFRNLPLSEVKQKLSQALLRRGFSWETIKEILGKTEDFRE